MSTRSLVYPHFDSDRGLELQRFLQTFGEVHLHLRPEKLALRLNALDELDSIIGDLDAGRWGPCSDQGLMVRAEALRFQFEAANQALYRAAHTEIATHEYSPVLEDWLRKMTPKENAERPRPSLSFDLLDEIVSGVFQLCGPKGENLCLPPEMTDYQPTPVRHILELIAACEFSKDDIFVDLGSGLGHVSLLVCVLTGTRTVGIEIQPSYTASAQQAAMCLNLERVRFAAEDARTANLAEGTVFYMFAPFTGSILADVLDRLHQQSRLRPIRICTLGPCTRNLQSQTWLIAIQQPDPERITIFRSR